MCARAVCGNVCSDRYAHTYVATRCNADTHANNACIHAHCSMLFASSVDILFSIFVFSVFFVRGSTERKRAEKPVKKHEKKCFPSFDQRDATMQKSALAFVAVSVAAV